MPRNTLPALLCLLLLAPACPGGMDISNLPPGHIDGGGTGQTFAYSDTSTIAATGELGLPPPSADTGAPAADTLAPDLTPAPDTLPQLPPDTGPTLPPGVGQPCPCASDLVCVDGACRSKCTAPTDACKAVADCPADNACLLTTGGFSVCVPATAAPGAACDNAKWCPVNYVCGSVSGSSYKCLPTCTTAGTACGAGGKCLLAANGCSFCSSP